MGAFGALVTAHAEAPRKDVLPEPPAPLGSLELDAETIEGTLYHALWRSSDIEIERNDLPRWSQSDFAATTPGFVSMKNYEANASSLNGYGTADRALKRATVASRIWDQRLLTVGNHAYARLRERSRAVGQADAAVNALGNGGVNLARGSAPRAGTAKTAPGNTTRTATAATLARPPAAEPLQFRYGYLVLADAAFFTLRQTGVFDLTLRRFKLLTAGISSGGYGGAPTFLSFQKPLGIGLPTPTLTFAVHSPALDLALAHPLSPFADVSLTGGHDFVVDSDRFYFTLAYRF